MLVVFACFTVFCLLSRAPVVVDSRANPFFLVALVLEDLPVAAARLLCFFPLRGMLLTLTVEV